jgi:hypothetical protein
MTSVLSNDKLLLIIFYFLDAQNAGKSISRFQISKIFCGLCPHTRGLQPLVSPSNKYNDKLRLIFFFTFCAFFPSFISNTSTVSINFRANLDAQNAGNGISVLQISKIFWGSTPPHT